MTPRITRRHDVDVWTLRTGVPVDVPDIMLTAAERERLGRLLPADRRRSGLGMALLRLALADWLAARWEDIVVDRACRRCGRPHGRPRLGDRPDLSLSVSHAGDRVLVAVSGAGAVGVDVEERARVADGGLAAAILSPAERCRSVVPDLAGTWVRKEAYLKARGVGLAVRPADVTLEEFDDRSCVVRAPGLTTVVTFTSIDVGDAYSAVSCLIGTRRPVVRVRDGASLLLAGRADEAWRAATVPR